VETLNYSGSNDPEHGKKGKKKDKQITNRVYLSRLTSRALIPFYSFELSK